MEGVIGFLVLLGLPSITGAINRRKGRSFFLGFAIHFGLVLGNTLFISPALLSTSSDAIKTASLGLNILVALVPIAVALRLKPTSNSEDSSQD